MRVSSIVKAAARSIARAMNWPVDVSVKVLSMTGITRVITRAAVTNIRKERFSLASMALYSPLLVLALVGMAFSFSVGDGYAWARAVIGVAAVTAPIYFKGLSLERRSKERAMRRQAVQRR